MNSGLLTVSQSISQMPVDVNRRTVNPTSQTTWQRTKTPGLLRHKSGRYYGRFTVGGKTRFVALKTTLADIARIRFAEEKARVERTRKAARKAGDGAATMGDLAILERQRIAQRSGVSDKTRLLNAEAVSFLEKTEGFAKLRPNDITPTTVEQWRDYALANGTGFRPPGTKTERKGASGSTVNKAFGALVRMLNLAVDMGAIASNPLLGRRGLRAPDNPRKPHLPEHAQLEKVFAEIASVGGRGVRAAEFCRFLALTGCRKGEAAGVRVCDIDLARGILRVNGTKTDAARREVPLIPAARALVDKLLARLTENAPQDGEGRAVLAPETPLLGVREAQKSLDRACAKVGVPRLTHHDLRDAFATACIEAGVDIPTTAAWLGHADGGALLMRTYAHHRRAHSVAMAAKVTFGSAA